MTGTMIEMDVRGETVGVKDGTMRRRETIVEKRRKREEPAWMDDYVAGTPGGGSLGGQGADAGLDGIQVSRDLTYLLRQ